MLDGPSAGVEAKPGGIEADPTQSFGPIVVDRDALESLESLGSAEPRRRFDAYRWREVVVVLACLAVWIWRRPAQLTRPYVWAEESHVLSDYAHHGWVSAVHSIGGYEALPASFLTTLSVQISFARLPVLMYVFATLIYLITISIIVFPESRWGDFRLRAAFAVCVTLVPTNPEVFGVLLYSFWWATLWPLAILAWKNPNYKIRIPLLVIASFSSPAGGALCIVFLIAYLRKRQRSDLISAVVLVPGFLVDSIQSLTGSRASGVAHAKVGPVLDQSLRSSGEFLSRWLLRDPIDYHFVVLLGFALLVFVLYAGAELVIRRRDEVAMLWAAAIIYLVVSSWPAPLRVDPFGNGPRYFFLPFVALSWALVCVFLRATQQQVRIAALALLIVASFNLPSTFSRSKAETRGNLSWTSELNTCEAAPDEVLVGIPIYLDGSNGVHWTLDLTPAQCRRLVRDSLI